jgi:hypothetical protein
MRVGLWAAVALSAALPAPTLAETPMTGAEFQAYIGTSTVSYLYNDGFIGQADYGPDQTLLWRYDVENEPCQKGFWYQTGDALCFEFEDQKLGACWHFYRQSDGIVGIGIGEVEGVRIIDVARTDTPLSCPADPLGA